MSDFDMLAGYTNADTVRGLTMGEKNSGIRTVYLREYRLLY